MKQYLEDRIKYLSVEFLNNPTEFNRGKLDEAKSLMGHLNSMENSVEKQSYLRSKGWYDCMGRWRKDGLMLSLIEAYAYQKNNFELK